MRQHRSLGTGRRTPGIPHAAESAAFPLGGIGTGIASLEARGELRGGELETRPDQGRQNPYSHFMIHAAPAAGAPVSRVLEARLTCHHDGDGGDGIDQLAGPSHLSRAAPHGEYPTIDIDFIGDAYASRRGSSSRAPSTRQTIQHRRHHDQLHPSGVPRATERASAHGIPHRER